MKVLVTGGAGFIGAHVARALTERGERVHVVDDFDAYYDPALKQARIAALLPPGTPATRLDIADREPVTQLFRDTRPDAVIHLAAWAGVSVSRQVPDLVARANIAGTVNVFEACRQTGCRHVLFASSSCVYAPEVPVPSPESAPTDRPLSGYGVTKQAGELYARLYHDLDGLWVTCLRFFTVYGPWGRPDMAIWKFTRRLLRDEPISLHVRAKDGREVRRDFTEIRDVVRGVLAALDRPVPWDVVNLGAADPVPLHRLVRALEVATGRRARIDERTLPDDEAVETGADLTRARARLDFSPTVKIEEGVADFVRWYEDEFRAKFPRELAPSQYWQA